ncbi:MAG TPA: 16S rRNA (guanine(966)-N(2))-methyltransferase RsmD [Ignavibacteriaceae bacterium]|jgi:16S rRNA (guanine966-N2)-methyltransferase|nr:16S rRNA (guanine(966)-N(2))-methyltransferase RsmD [Ignavibacteriaceae bacterium]HOJ17364.1 16S rRNA (guanine(966)-N(2))-methyltransferase RsmD [Ignavibacteriaceae bacterium]
MRLRIISGALKGRFIKAPDSDVTRPMTDRVRETLFNILNNTIDFENIHALDLFSGSGAIGFECISRGAAFTCFIEKNAVVRKNLESNINSLDIKNRTSIFGMDVNRFLETTDKKFDLIVADPPFFDDSVHKGVKIVKDKKILNKHGIMVVERSVLTAKKDIEMFGIEPGKKIGDALLYFFPESNIDD